MIKRFHQGIGFYNTWCEDNKVLEPYSKMDIANMATVGGPHSPYFHSYLHVIHELGVLILFTPFEVDLLEFIDVAPC